MQSRIARSASGVLDKATKKTLALHIFRRAFLIFAIKMFLTAYPHFHYHSLRIYGVLTRIALCYLVAGLICLFTQRARTLLAITAALLVGYWALMRFVPVPGLGTPTHNFPILDHDNNLAAWLDRIINAFTQRTLQTGRLYEHTRDPEGLLSTLPAIATTLIGSVTAIWLREVKTINTRSSEAAVTLRGLATAGVCCLSFGLLWSLSFPINKNLWTSSYVLYSAGWSLLTLALCYWLIDMRRLNETRAGKALLWPWLVFGSNAITAFVISNFLVLTLIWIKVPNSFTGKTTTLLGWLYQHIFARQGSTNVTSLAFAIAFVAVCLIPNWLLWRKRIFLKV